MAESEIFRSSDPLDLRLIDRFLLALWVYTFAVLLWTFRVITRFETRSRKARKDY
jgi:hypothetical protein